MTLQNPIQLNTLSTRLNNYIHGLFSWDSSVDYVKKYMIENHKNIYNYMNSKGISVNSLCSGDELISSSVMIRVSKPHNMCEIIVDDKFSHDNLKIATFLHELGHVFDLIDASNMKINSMNVIRSEGITDAFAYILQGTKSHILQVYNELNEREKKVFGNNNMFENNRVYEFRKNNILQSTYEDEARHILDRRLTNG